MRFLILIIGCFALMIFNAQTAYSCSCVNIGTPQKELKKAQAVFIGEVIQIYPGYGSKQYPALIKLKVERYWKGIKKTETIEILSDLGLHSCRTVPIEGKYIVYAYKKGSSLITHGCTRTRPLDEAEDDLKALGEGKIFQTKVTNRKAKVGLQLY
jgi:hypothetical protein